MADKFEALAEGLPDNQKTEFLQILREAEVSQYDTELAKLFRALQIYKSYYQTIPEAIQKSVAEINKMNKRAEEINGACENSFSQLLQYEGQVNEALKKIHLNIDEAVKKAGAVVSKRMSDAKTNISAEIAAAKDKINTEITTAAVTASNNATTHLTAALEKAIPLSQMEEAGEVLSDVIESGKEASEELHKNIKLIRLVHYKSYAIAALSIVVLFCYLTRNWYQTRYEKDRAAVIKQIEDNRDVLLELARAKRKLELTVSDKGTKLLVLKNATGWTTTSNNGVIEYEE